MRVIKLNQRDLVEWFHETGCGSAYVGDVLRRGFREAQAFVVLMTPDDEARLREGLRGKDEEEYEINLTLQPRQNVTYEAGMAMGIDERRTILVQLGKIRPMSDTLGRHIIRLDDSPQRRKALAQRLAAAKCPIDLHRDDSLTAAQLCAALEDL